MTFRIEGYKKMRMVEIREILYRIPEILGMRLGDPGMETVD